MSFYAQSSAHFDGAILLYRRQSANGDIAPIWQTRLKLPGRSGYIIRSCKTRNYEEAYDVAKQLYLAYQQRIKDGVPLRDWSFKQQWEDWYGRQVRKGVWRREREKWHRNYFHRYFNAYFGDKALGEITPGFAEGYFEWRISYWQRAQGEQLRTYNPKRRSAKSRTSLNAKLVPADKTLQMEASALNQIFADACQHRRMSLVKIKAPKLSRQDTRRPTFDESEFALVLRNLEDWENSEGRYKHDRLNSYQRNRRLQLVCLVGFLASTGLRVGEARKMRWEDITLPGGQSFLTSQVNSPDLKYLHIRVRADTKQGRSRTVISMPAAYLWVAIWRSASSRTNPQDYVWQGQAKSKDGANVVSGDFNKTFQSLLKTVPYKGRPDGLLRDPDGRARTIYSLRHFYATQRLIDGDLDPLTLAENMGTSVVQIQKHYSHVSTVLNAPKLTADRRRTPSSDATHRAMERVVEKASIRLGTSFDAR